MTLGEKIVLFERGTIQQIGTPEDVYEKPANIFAATFIGAPRINLIRGHIAINKEEIIFKSGELAFNVTDRKELKQYANREVTMGIRPESLGPGEGHIKGTLELVERLGPETLLYVKTPDVRLIAKAPSDFRGKRNREISLVLSNTGIHFFYKGERIRQLCN